MTDEDRVRNIIKKIAEEQNFQTYNVKVTPISSGGTNYTSKLYLVKITEKDKDDLNLFAKVAAISESFRDLIPMDPFEIEFLAYTNLLTAYRRLEDKHDVVEENRLKFSTYYGVDMTPLREILVLEDLTSRGFGQANRFQPVDWQYAAAAVTELAKFHALSFAYKHEEPSEYDKTYAKFPGGYMQQNDETDIFFNSAIKSALEEVREENKEKLKMFLEDKNLGNAMFDMFKPLSLEVFLHVDFRPSNLMHKRKDDGTTEVIPVDYQSVQGGCPLIDLLYFIFTATDGQFRAQHYKELVDHYHSELGAALARLGLNVEDKYPKKVFEFELKQKLPFGLLVSIMILPSLTVPEDQAPALDKDLNFSSFAVKKTGEQYSQRINEAVDHFVKYGVLS